MHILQVLVKCSAIKYSALHERSQISGSETLNLRSILVTTAFHLHTCTQAYEYICERKHDKKQYNKCRG